MSQWKNDDSVANSVLWAVEQYNNPANTTTQTAFFGNTTADVYVTGITVGQFGVDSDEQAAARQAGTRPAHAGWVVKTTGSGGRAGRVQYETLVAMGSMSGDAEDVAFPDKTIVISVQPANASANSSANEQAEFTVTAATVPTGGTLAYQWTYANGNALGVSGYAGGTTATLTVNANTVSNGESYVVEISTTGATNVTSTAATITITT